MILTIPFKRIALAGLGLCGLCLAFSAQAQIEPQLPRLDKIPGRVTADSANIRVWYALNALDLADSKTYDDLQCLELGDKLSCYYSAFFRQQDSAYLEWKKANPQPSVGSARFKEALGGKLKSWSEYVCSEYVKNPGANSFTEYARMATGVPDYYYTEAMPVQQWEIGDSTALIAGFACQQAFCRFGGRDFTAWFTAEVPVSNGPWKLGGLPGLIVKAYDADRLYCFELVGIESAASKLPVSVISDKRFAKTTRAKLLKLQKEVHVRYLKVTEHTVSFGPISGLPTKELVYHPLELE